jgi:hypothetical protein
MKNRFSFAALALTALFLSLFACTKEESPAPVQDEPKTDYIPDASRLSIRFGTSTQMGCMYTFRNCIYIDLWSTATNRDGLFGLEFEQGGAAAAYFGQYFPLTSDYRVDDSEAQALGIAPQVLPAGFYALREAGAGQATGRRLALLAPGSGAATGSLSNPNNPQDNIGQLHNLAVQQLLYHNSEALAALKDDRAAAQRFIAEKVADFLAESELPVPEAQQQRAKTLDIHRNYADYAARLNETRLSADDKKTLLAIFDQANAMPMNSPADLRSFLAWITEAENNLVAQKGQLDDAKAVLSMVSVLKYSRYFWFWRSISFPQTGGGGAEPASRIPDWVWADIIGMELGGPLVSAIASTAVYLDQR